MISALQAGEVTAFGKAAILFDIAVTALFNRLCSTKPYAFENFTYAPVAV